MARTVHIDLGEECGLDGQWLDLRDPRYVTQRKYEQLAGAVKTDQEVFLREFVVAWRIVDEDTGAVLTDPASDDLKALTLAHIRTIGAQFEKLTNNAVPKAS